MIEGTSSIQDPNARGGWDSKLEYLLSSIGYAVGLGNVWRFPYLCYKNGGGAFLVPYLTLLALCGLPIFLLENSLGQFSSQGPTRAFNGMPLMKGIGFSMITVSCFVAPYYNVILSWVMYYIWETINAFKTGKLPWEDCRAEYGNFCFTRAVMKNCDSNLDHLKNICPKFETEYNLDSHTAIHNFANDTGSIHTACLNEKNITVADYSKIRTDFTGACKNMALRQAAPELFYEKIVLGQPPRPEYNANGGQLDDYTTLGGIQWHLFFTLCLSWIVISFSIIRGVKSTGKTMYFTATFPYLVLTILLICGITKDGAMYGIKYFLTPKFDNLGKADVWKDAATQIFYSLSVSWGGLLTLSSYNPFRNNLIRDTYIVVCANSGTSIYAGIAIFAYLGILAKSLALPIDEIVSSGPGFAFIVWPEAMTHISQNPYVQITFSLLFFLMLYSLGLSTMVVTVETVVTSLLDLFNNLRKERVKVVLSVVSVFLIIGTPLVTSRGLFWFQVFDDYAASYSLVVSTIVEMLAISWVYGIYRASNDLKMMTDSHLNTFFRITWAYVTPFLLIIMLVFNVAKHEYTHLKYYGQKYYMGSSSYPLAIILVLTPISWVIGLMIRELLRQTKANPQASFTYLWNNARKPTRHWGPLQNSDREAYNSLRDDQVVYQRHDLIDNDEEETIGLKTNLVFENQTSSKSSCS